MRLDLNMRVPSDTGKSSGKDSDKVLHRMSTAETGAQSL